MKDNPRDQARWQQFRLTGSRELRDEIIRDYAILARRAVERLQIKPWGCVCEEDLLSNAVIGLLDAIDRYDPTFGIPFEGFAMPRIRGAVLDALRSIDWAPRSVRAQENLLRRTMGHLEERLGRPPTNGEVADELGVDEEELDRMFADVARTSLVSLDDLVTGMDDGSSLGEITPGPHGLDPYRRNVRSDARRRLAGAIAALPEREKLVVSLYYGDDMTLKEIGQVLGVTEQRVSQIHARAVLRMSHKLMRHEDLLMSLAA